MQKALCRTATHAVRSRMNESFVTGAAVRGTVWCWTNVVSLRGRHFMGCHSPSATHQEKTRLRRLSFAYFSLARQRKVGAAPHRGNANKPQAKQGKARKIHCGNSAAPIRRAITPARWARYPDPRCSSKYLGLGNITASLADCAAPSFAAEVL